MAMSASVVVVALWVAGWVRFGATPELLAWCWACGLGTSLVVTDLRLRRLPFPLVAAFAGGVAMALFGAAAAEAAWARFGFACLAAVAVFALAFVVQWCFPGHTGGGDTALYGALALYLGWFGWDGLLTGLLAASGLTALVGLVVAVFSRNMGSRFPAGPSLIIGALASIVLL
ncbi:methyltransferase [Prauserella marina]|nr:methyltransferase [Prauserella marina]